MPVIACRAGRRLAVGGLGQLGWYRGSSRPYGMRGFLIVRGAPRDKSSMAGEERALACL